VVKNEKYHLNYNDDIYYFAPEKLHCPGFQTADSVCGCTRKYKNDWISLATCIYITVDMLLITPYAPDTESITDNA
jgi:hypothetical protein